MANNIDNAMLERIEQKLDRLETRLNALEERFNQSDSSFVPRSDWVDLCARLDIVEQLTSETLGQVRSKLESFSKDIKHIAVIPERELNEMFDMVRHIRLQLMPEPASAFFLLVAAGLGILPRRRKVS